MILELNDNKLTLYFRKRKKEKKKELKQQMKRDFNYFQNNYTLENIKLIISFTYKYQLIMKIKCVFLMNDEPLAIKIFYTKLLQQFCKLRKSYILLILAGAYLNLLIITSMLFSWI
jgi:hypothetical protein